MNKTRAKQAINHVKVFLKAKGHQGFKLELADHTGPGSWSVTDLTGGLPWEWTIGLPYDLVPGVFLEAINERILGVYNG